MTKKVQIEAVEAANEGTATAACDAELLATKPTGTKRAKRPKPVTLGERERARIERWRGHINKRLLKFPDLLGTVSRRWLEAVDGRKLEDILLDWTIQYRGLGATANAAELFRREQDELAEETMTVRGLAAQEKSEVTIRMMSWLQYPLNVHDERNGAAFVRYFYRRGDIGLNNAHRRAIDAAICWEREAEEAEKPPRA